MLIDPANVLDLYPLPWSHPSTQFQKQTAGWSGGSVWRVRSNGKEGALRRWPDSFPLSRIQAIHAAQRHAGNNGCLFIPQVIHSKEGTGVIPHDGSLWELVEWMPGEPADQKSPSRDQLRGAAVALAEWHQVFSSPDTPLELNHLANPDIVRAYRSQQSIPSPAITRRLAEWNRLVSFIHKERAESSFTDVGFLTERTKRLIGGVYPSLNRLMPWESRPVTVILSLPDLHREHVLFSQGKVSGIIDLGGVTIDTPAVDIARYASSFDARFCPLHEVVRTMVQSYRDRRALDDSLVSLINSIVIVSTAIGALHWWEWLTTTDKIPADRNEAAIHRWEELVQQVERWCDDGM